jgi:hypothetical protein
MIPNINWKINKLIVVKNKEISWTCISLNFNKVTKVSKNLKSLILLKLLLNVL